MWFFSRPYIDGDGNACAEEVELDGENYYARLYTDNIDWNAWTYAEGSSDEDALPTLVRIGSWWTEMQIVVYDSDGNWLCDYWPYVEDVGYSITMTPSYFYYNEDEDYTYYYVFDTDDLTLSVEQSEDSNALPDGYTVEYYLCDEENDSNYVTLTNNGDNTATLSVDLSEDLINEGYTSDYWVGVYAVVSYEGNEIASYHDLWLEVLVAYDDYYTFGDYTIVLGDGDWVSNTFGHGYRNMGQVYGAYDEIAVSNMEITASYVWDDDAGDYVETDDGIIWLDGSYENGGWSINTSGIGYATVTAYYTDADEEEQSCEFTVNVVGSRSWIDNYGWTDGLNTDDMLVGAQRELSMSYVVESTVWDDEGNYWTEYTYYSLADLPDGYYLSLVPENENISAEVTEDGTILVTANGTGGAWLEVYVLDEDGNVVGDGSSQWVGTRDDSYYTITGDLGIVPLGDTLDLSAVDFTLTYYYIDEDGNACVEEVELDGENYYARLDIDNINWNAWTYADGSSEEDALPTLVRLENWDTNMRIEVCDSDGNGLCDYWPGVSSYGYGAYIEESYDEENYIFELIEWPGNDYDFPEGYTVYWNVYVDTEDSWQDASDYGVTYSVENNILTITEWEHTDIIVQPYACYRSENYFCWFGEYYCTLHTYALKRTEEATCTEEGYNYYVCTNCGETLIETILATGHSWKLDDAVTENVVEATCITAGSYETVIYCATCDEELARATTTVPATGHSYGDPEFTSTKDEAGTMTATSAYPCSTGDDTQTLTAAVTSVTTAAACTETGQTVYTATVTFDGVEYTDTLKVDIPAAGHTLEKVAAVAATCTENGNIEYYRCSVCGALFDDAEETNALTEADIVAAATGHTLVKVDAVAATCTEAGNIEYYKCADCGALFDDAEKTNALTEAETVLAATGHTAGTAAKENVVAATCTTAGSYDTVIYCANCGEELARATTTVPATGHTWGEGEGAPAATGASGGVG
ncbi:MAG: hypothetical protein LUE91_03260, partial [Oscillospiraceae bacterium]|nr:hypothetical protein [Oscillospiraceae bacterium]